MEATKFDFETPMRKNPRSSFSHAEIESGLTSSDANIRQKFARLLEYHASAEQIDRGLGDEDGQVRAAFMLASKLCSAQHSITPEQLERGLTDSTFLVRWYATGFKNFKPTPFQLERGLNDERSEIRSNFVRRFYDQMTQEQIVRGLFDEDSVVRSESAGICYILEVKLTPEQIERGLSDESDTVRLWFSYIRSSTR